MSRLITLSALITVSVLTVLVRAQADPAAVRYRDYVMTNARADIQRLSDERALNAKSAVSSPGAAGRGLGTATPGSGASD